MKAETENCRRASSKTVDRLERARARREGCARALARDVGTHEHTLLRFMARETCNAGTHALVERFLEREEGAR